MDGVLIIAILLALSFSLSPSLLPSLSPSVSLFFAIKRWPKRDYWRCKASMQVEYSNSIHMKWIVFSRHTVWDLDAVKIYYWPTLLSPLFRQPIGSAQYKTAVFLFVGCLIHKVQQKKHRERVGKIGKTKSGKAGRTMQYKNVRNEKV